MAITNKRTYQVTIDTDDPAADLDAAMRATIGWLSDNIETGIDYGVEITVTTAGGEPLGRGWSEGPRGLEWSDGPERS